MDFFTEDKLNFFRPVSGKHREMVVQCIKRLYVKLYSPDADYEVFYTRKDLREMFVSVVSGMTPISSSDGEDDEPLITDSNELSKKIVSDLLDCGWLEVSHDAGGGGAMRRTCRFTRSGKMIARSFITMETKGFNTRQRNVRNTANALQSFLQDSSDIHNLIDAFKYASEVNSDLSDDIIDIHERKTQLLKEASQNAGMAFNTFMDYMNNEFVPDLSIRFSADNVDKYKGKILRIIEEIRKLPESAKKNTTKKLNAAYPEYSKEYKSGILDHLLNQIETMLISATRGKMKELRLALRGFIRRSTYIVLQAQALTSPNYMAQWLKHTGELPDEDQDKAFKNIGSDLLPTLSKLPDPGKFNIREIKADPPPLIIEEERESTREERLAAWLEEAEEHAYSVSEKQMEQIILEQMDGSYSFQLSNFRIHSVKTLLTLAHCIETGAQKKGGPLLSFEPILNQLGKPLIFNTPFGVAEDYLIRELK